MKKTATTIALLVVAVPLLLWLDVWLAIQFTGWARFMGATPEGASFDGFLAFVALVGTQIAAVVTYMNNKETK